MSRALSIYHGPFGRVSIYDLDRPMTMHAHREGHLTFNLAGAPGCITVSGKPSPCDRPHGVAINPWEPHAFHQAEPGTRGLYLVLYINPTWYMRHVGAGDPAGLFFVSTSIAISRDIALLIDDVRRMMASHRTLPGFEQALIDLACECGRTSREQPLATGGAARGGFAGIDFRVKKSIDLLTGRPFDEGARASMEAVARRSGLSRAHFFKLFRDHTGITPNLYVNTLQIERALKAVAESGDPVTHIGEDLGFSSQSAFTRFFTAHVGMAPTDYRAAVTVVG